MEHLGSVSSISVSKVLKSIYMSGFVVLYLGASNHLFLYNSCLVGYMCKYAPNAVASLLFLDPICFCLYFPRLTKSFVYHAPDPGVVTYMVRTDLMINWTIQVSLTSILCFGVFKFVFSLFSSILDISEPSHGSGSHCSLIRLISLAQSF
jgi:hypothetical protein